MSTDEELIAAGRRVLEIEAAGLAGLVPRIGPGFAAAARLIAEAGGREVSFVGTVNAEGVVSDARVIARGTVDCVLALPG